MDEIFDVRNNFFLGHYQQCISAAQRINPSDPDIRAEKDIYMYRAFIAQAKYNMVLNEIQENAKAELKAVRFYAQYMQSPAQHNNMVEALDALLADPISGSSPTVQLMAGTIAYLEGDYDRAMQIVASTNSLECIALIIQACLKLDRVDVAVKEVKRMARIDDDATLTQLATAWVHISVGGEKCQEAFYIYQDLKVKYSPSSLLLNGEATCLIHQGKYAEADLLLQEAMSLDSNDPQTLVNMIVVNQKLSKPTEVVKRYMTQLMDMAPTHPFVKTYEKMDDSFNRAAAQYSVIA